jgi:large subunit ribosomal protein L22
MAYRYTFQGYNEERMARAVGVRLPISPKEALEVCSFIKHRPLERAKKILNNVLEYKQAIPFKRHNADVAHKPGIAAGRYPQNVCREILKIIESVEANANNKGLTNELYITHMNAHRAPPQPRGGRVPGEGKMAHVEIVVEELKKEEKKAVKSKNHVAKEKKAEAKPQ